MIFCIFTMRPDGSSWQYRGDIDAPNDGAAKYVAETMLKSIDGVKREVAVRAPGETFPIKDGPASSNVALPVLSKNKKLPPKIMTVCPPRLDLSLNCQYQIYSDASGIRSASSIIGLAWSIVCPAGLVRRESQRILGTGDSMQGELLASAGALGQIPIGKTVLLHTDIRNLRELMVGRKQNKALNFLRSQVRRLPRVEIKFAHRKARNLEYLRCHRDSKQAARSGGTQPDCHYNEFVALLPVSTNSQGISSSMPAATNSQTNASSFLSNFLTVGDG